MELEGKKSHLGKKHRITLNDYFELHEKTKRNKSNEETPIKENHTISKEKIENVHEKESSSIIEKEDTPKRLSRSFFTVDVVTLAKNLLGQQIVRITPKGETRFKIVETEAYKAPEDKACHAYNNKKTERTKFFWQDGGCLYIFMIYGHCCLNITAATKSEPEAVLIRAVEPVSGIDIVRDVRKSKKDVDLTNGPGKVGDAMMLSLDDNGVDLCSSGEMYMVEGDEEVDVGVSKRINIDYAEEWKDKMWRFYIKGNKYVSKVPNKKK